MVQEFQVLRCFSCHTFQVHQVKKSKKWACKLCGEKQSLLKVYGQGSAADCRCHVQKLNLLQGEVEQTAISSAVPNFQTEDQEDESTERKIEPTISRWSKYMEPESETVCEKQEDDDIYSDRNIAAIAEARKRKMGLDQNVCRGFPNISKRNKSCEEWSLSPRGVQPTCIKTENTSCYMGYPERTEPQAAEESSSLCFKSRKLASPELALRGNLSSTNRFQMPGPNMELTLNTYQLDEKTVPATGAAGGLPGETKMALSHKGEIGRPIKEEGLPEFIPKPSTQNVYCSIFQTEDDFDDDY